MTIAVHANLYEPLLSGLRALGNAGHKVVVVALERAPNDGCEVLIRREVTDHGFPLVRTNTPNFTSALRSEGFEVDAWIKEPTLVVPVQAQDADAALRAEALQRAIREAGMMHRRDCALQVALKAARRRGYTPDESRIVFEDPPLTPWMVCTVSARLVEDPSGLNIAADVDGEWGIWGKDAEGKYFEVQRKARCPATPQDKIDARCAAILEVLREGRVGETPTGAFLAGGRRNLGPGREAVKP